MLNAINYATRHFCTDVFGYEIKEGKSLGKDLYGASIPLYKDDVEFQFYLYFKKETLELFVDKLFNTEEAKKTDLGDLSREVANQIVGYAKHLLSDNNNGVYKLGTPEFLGKVERFPVRLEKSHIFKMKNKTFKIGYKKVWTRQIQTKMDYFVATMSC